MTETFIKYIADALKATFPWIDEMTFVGRLTEDGYAINDKNYIGIDDRRGQYGYFRFRGEKDHRYEETKKPVSRGKWFKVNTEIRLVMVVDLSQCDSVNTLESQLVSAIASMQLPQSKARVTLVNSSSDGERIFIEETKNKKNLADYISLISIDFDLEYYSSDCCEVVIPSGDCQGGTYTNRGGTFVRVIENGEIYEAPDITVEEVDGSTSEVPANTNVQCQWVELEVEASDGVVLKSVPAFENPIQLAVIQWESDTESGTVPVRLFLEFIGGDPLSVGATATTIQVQLPSGSPATYENYDGSYSESIPCGTIFVAPRITVTDVDGNTRLVPSNIDVVALWIELTGENTDGDSLVVLAVFPVGGVFVVPDQSIDILASDAYVIASVIQVVGKDVESPDIEVIDDVAFMASLPARAGVRVIGAEITSAVINGDYIDVTVDGGSAPVITPNYPTPQLTTSILYTGDLGYLFANGYFDRCFVPGKLKYTLDAADNYYLDPSTPNPWGNLDRFVYDDGTAAWNGTIFPASPVGATANIIIDVWAGLIIYRPNLGSLAGFAGAGYASPAEYALGLCLGLTVGSYSDFRAMSMQDVLAIIPDQTNFYYASTNPLTRASVSGFNENQFYLANTDASGANFYVLTASGDIVRRSKATSSLTSVYAVMNWP